MIKCNNCDGYIAELGDNLGDSECSCYIDGLKNRIKELEQSNKAKDERIQLLEAKIRKTACNLAELIVGKKLKSPRVKAREEQ